MIKRALLFVFFGGCLVAAGLALSAQNVIVILPHNNTTPAATTLQSLTLSANSFTVGDPQGTFVGNVQNTTAGSTVTFNGLSVANSLQLANVAGVWQIQVGSSAPGSPSTLTFNLVETLGGISNSPRTTSGFTVNENAAVFSWYMTPFYTYSSPGDPDATAVAGYKRDIQDAQASGVDGFVLYIGNHQYLYDNTRNMFEAAKELHDADPSKPPFLLFLGPEAGVEGDVRQLFPGTGTDWLVYFMNAFASHPNYYHYQGKAVLGSFLGLDQQSDWVNDVFTPLHNQGIDVFFVPSIFDANPVTTNGTTLTSWGQTNIGSFNYWTGNVPYNDIGGNNNLANISQLNGKPFVANVSGANYWSVNLSSSQGVYFEHYGGEGPAQEWQNAISLNPIFIIETTWNDYTESYTTPVDIPNVPTVNTGYNIEQLLTPHVGYSELMKYYSQWYKTGVQPTIAKDGLMYFYRTHAMNLVASNDTSVTNFNPNTSGEKVPDDLFVTTQLTAPATLRVTTGGVVTTYSLPAGVNFTRIPFSAGAQQFAVIRGV